jgi:glyoxylase-like metal-dependent hydrolase (beta-lactamase superfamily II)
VLRRFTFLATLASCVCASAQSADAPMQLASDVYVIRGAYPVGSQPDGNSIVILAREGIIVVDTGRHVSHTQQIVDFLKLGERPLVAIVNTHWHLDHIGGNVMLRAQFPGVQVYASDALRTAQTGFLASYRQQLEQAIAEAKPTDDVAPWRTEIALIDAGPKLLPDHVIDRSRNVTLAGRRLAVHLEKNAATDGDVWLEDPTTGILLAGDLVTLPVPFLDTACASGWETALDHLAATRFDTLVPGHGVPMDRERFDLYRTAFHALRACAASDQATYACAKEWREGTGDLIALDDIPRVPAMIDYYVKALRAPARYCTKMK